ncbi:Coatomer, beta' subunit [Neoconidiobolus thromboides FSU 785]|nr:Coatomer, beta' subunit [Neoconidiobolus thromboides FSU 785]
MKLNIKKNFLTRSDRVKCVDFHPTEPWVLTALYNGNVYIWNYNTQNLVKTLEVTGVPVRCAKFIPRKNWFVTGSDDKQIRIFNYNTLEKVASFDAHTDYIRSIVVHPTQPIILTCSDDLSIKCWDWEKGWKCLQIFEGHTHYIMQLAINPKDTNTFASASLDKTVKVWNLGSPVANYTLEGHEKGVNCVDYYPGADKPYLITGADDKSVKIWDFTTKSCVQTISSHTNNITIVAFLSDLPLFLTGSEDGWVKIWQLNTYKMVTNINYGLDRAWSASLLKGSSSIALGFEEGTAVINLGSDDPVVSMDNGGKIIWAKHSEIQSSNIKASIDTQLIDGERVMLPVKDLGNCEVYPQTLQHSPNGRFVAVCGDGEYIIYTALAWRNKEFGKGSEFVWSQDSNFYAIRSSNNNIQLFKAFKPLKDSLSSLEDTPDMIYGGTLLGIRTTDESLLFFDWESNILVRKIEVTPKQVYWSETGEFVAVVCEDSFYILQYNRSAFLEYLESNGDTGSEGVEEAFDVVAEISESVITGKWVGDCFLYTSSLNRLNYLVGSEVNVITHFDRPMYLLGYIPRDSRVYLIDRDFSVISYALSLTVLEFQTLVLRGELDAAKELLPTIPESNKSKLAQFLDSQGYKELALEISDDPEQKFDFAISLGNLSQAKEIAERFDHVQKWQLIADHALQSWDITLAQECLEKAKDYSGLLLLYSSISDVESIKQLGIKARQEGQNNIALLCSLQLGDNEDIFNILLSTGRTPEAALFSRTYMPSKVPQAVESWKEELIKANYPKRAEALADPGSYPNLFPNYQGSLSAEKSPKETHDNGDVTPTATSPQSKVNGTEVETPTVDDGVSDVMSLVSMEVNTTGTGSVKGDLEVSDEVISPNLNADSLPDSIK